MPGWEQLAIPIGSAIIGGLASRGNSGASDEAIGGQLAMAKKLMEMLQGQQNVTLPFQQALYQSLRSRMNQGFTQRVPGQMPAFDPFKNAQPYQIGAPQNASIPQGSFISRPTGAPSWVQIGAGGRPIIGKPATGGV